MARFSTLAGPSNRYREVATAQHLLAAFAFRLSGYWNATDTSYCDRVAYLAADETLGFDVETN
jgi:hypothetical protein